MMFDKDGDGTVSTKGSLQVEKIKMNGNSHARGLSKDSVYYKND